MEPGDLLRIIMIGTGILLWIITLTSLARRKMTDTFSLIWGMVSIIIILAGILLRPAGWNSYISFTGLILVLIVGFCVIYCIYFICRQLSELMRKNQELAMQLALLKKQNDDMREQLDELMKKPE